MVCKCHTVTFRPEICVKMFIFKVDVQSDHVETKCSWVKVSQGKNVTVDVSSGSKCHSGRNVGGRNVKASLKGPAGTTFFCRHRDSVQFLPIGHWGQDFCSIHDSWSTVQMAMCSVGKYVMWHPVHAPPPRPLYVYINVHTWKKPGTALNNNKFPPFLACYASTSRGCSRPCSSCASW